jgi:hypothetical protein
MGNMKSVCPPRKGFEIMRTRSPRLWISEPAGWTRLREAEWQNLRSIFDHQDVMYLRCCSGRFSSLGTVSQNIRSQGHHLHWVGDHKSLFSRRLSWSLKTYRSIILSSVTFSSPHGRRVWDTQRWARSVAAENAQKV